MALHYRIDVLPGFHHGHARKSALAKPRRRKRIIAPMARKDWESTLTIILVDI